MSFIPADKISRSKRFSPTAVNAGFATVVYALVVVATALHHEPWADEAQAWLLARDSRLTDIWLRLLAYEGTPGLWHSLLFLLNRLHLNYSSLNVVSALFGTTAAFLVFRFAPFPLLLRILLPFTYFLAYQYAVVARSYSLVPPLLFGLAALYPARERRPFSYAALLSGLALSSMHGLVLSGLIAATTFRQRAIVLYAVAAALAAASAWPAHDVTFVRAFNFSPAHLLDTATHVLKEAVTGEWVTSAIAIAATVPLLRRGKMLLLFTASAAALISLSAVVYGQVWHFGMLFLIWVFALWIAVLRSQPSRVAFAFLSAVALIHCYWTAASVNLEWRTAYSGGRDVARYLASRGMEQSGVYGVGYATVAVQPYFQKNIFRNFEHTYWDWCSRNRMIADYDRLGEERPSAVLVGYKTAAENYLWNSQVRRSGYRRVRHFEGNLIWKGGCFEPESFDFYERQ